jgi:hypothetical protein
VVKLYIYIYIYTLVVAGAAVEERHISSLTSSRVQ